MTTEELSYWNNYSTKYNLIWDKTLHQKYISNLELFFIKKYLVTSKPINYLDIGCGYGRVLNFVDSIIDTRSKIFVVEPSTEMLKLCEYNYKGYPNLEVINTDFLAHNFDYPSPVFFDTITAIRVLKYYNSYEEWFRKIHTILSPGGIFLFSVTNLYSIAFFDKLRVRHYKISYKKLKKYLNDAGLEVLDVEGYQVLPEFIYAMFDNESYLKFIMKIESLLDTILPNLLFKRVLYVAVRKKR